MSFEGRLQQISYYLGQSAVNYDAIGKITKEGFFNRYIRAVWMNDDKPRLIKLIQFVNQAYEAAEQKGVKVFLPHLVPSQQLQAEADAYRRRHEIYFRVTHQVLDVALGNEWHNDPAVRQELDQIKYSLISLQYNLGESLGGRNALKNPDEVCFKKLNIMAQEWKSKQKGCDNHAVNALEVKELEMAACHPLWANMVMQNHAHFDEFMKWSIRDYNPVEIMIKYFHTQKKIKAAILSQYLGYSRDPANETLAIKTVATATNGIMRKVLCLPIYNGSFKEFEPDKQKWVNVLKPKNLIHFERGNYWITVEELFKLSANKDLTEVNPNLCANWGVVNFHPAYGYHNADTGTYDEMPSESQAWTRDNWIDKTPPMRVATQEEMEKIYGNKIKERKFFYQVRATRTELNLKALGCHGFLTLYVALPDGKWKVLNVGIYAYRFQQNTWEAVQMFADTLKRVLSLQDQNGVYTFRQRAAMTFFPALEKTKEFTDQVYDRLLRTEGVFQLAAINCSYAIQSTVNSVLDKPINFFKMTMTKATSGIAPVDWVLKFADTCSEKIREIIFYLLHRMLFSHRQETVKGQSGPQTYSTCKFFNENGVILHNPSYFPHQIQEAKKTGEHPFVNGRLYWGNTEERLQPFLKDEG